MEALGHLRASSLPLEWILSGSPWPLERKLLANLNAILLRRVAILPRVVLILVIASGFEDTLNGESPMGLNFLGCFVDCLLKNSSTSVLRVLTLPLALDLGSLSELKK